MKPGFSNQRDADSSEEPGLKPPRIILAGGTGFLGQLLARRFSRQNHAVVILSRAPQKHSPRGKVVSWDGQMIGDWWRELDGADTVVNLSGRSVNCRYNEQNRRLILDSRVQSTRVLGEAIGRCAQPPRAWLNASTATIYKHSYDQPMDEAGEIGGTQDARDEFSVEVAQAWEQAFDAARTPQTRKIALRLAMVFSAAEGTVYRVLRRLVRSGLGGAMAGGRQFASWIHEEDFLRAIDWLISHEDFSGPVNLTAPNPVSNREMMRVLGKVCGAPFGLPAARWMMEVGAFFLRTETELMIKSRRVIPGRLMSSGFEFRFPQFEEAVREIESHVV